MDKLQRDVRWLKTYACIITLLLGVLALAAFSQANQKTKFAEINVERINIVEKDGKLNIVISNGQRRRGVAGLCRQDQRQGCCVALFCYA